MVTKRTRNSTTDPALIVFGKPLWADKLQAAWFRAAQADRARAAAKQNDLAIIPIDSDETRSIAASLTEGSLKARGRIALSDIDEPVLQRVLALLVSKEPPRGAAALAAPHTTDVATPTTPQTPSGWDAPTVNGRVLAQYFDGKGEFGGWWEATVADIKADLLFLCWPDEPELGVFRRTRSQIGLFPTKT